MKIILLKDVAKIGRKHDVKQVSDGYALNFLIPRGAAVVATDAAIRNVENEKARLAGEERLERDLTIKIIKNLDGKRVVMKSKADSKGSLFAGIHREQIATELDNQFRLTVDSNDIILEHPIKAVGEYVIEVKGAGKSAKFTLVVEKA